MFAASPFLTFRTHRRERANLELLSWQIRVLEQLHERTVIQSACERSLHYFTLSGVDCDNCRRTSLFLSAYE